MERLFTVWSSCLAANRTSEASASQLSNDVLRSTTDTKLLAIALLHKDREMNACLLIPFNYVRNLFREAINSKV
jgi:hypothetical protein